MDHTNVVFSDKAKELQAIARKIADEHVRPLAAKYDKAQEYNYEAARAVAEAGLFKTFIPEEYGGHGAGVLALALVAEELAKADSGFGVAFAVNALGSFPIILGGTEEQKKHWLPQIAAGDKFVAFCLSEKFAGSDAQGLSVRAFEDGDDYIICGEKKWTTNGGVADVYSVFAVTDPESKSRRISAFIVEKGTPGFEVKKVEDKMGIRCVPVVETHFDHVRVPKANLIGGRAGLGFRHAMSTLDYARPGVAAQAVGASQGALDLANVYANRRKQFGIPISGHQMVQQMMADMAMKTEAARRLVYTAAAGIDESGPSALNSKMAAMAKCFATDVAMEVATDAVQVFGGYGFMEDYPIAKFFRDAKILQIYEGTNQVQRLVIARHLIREAGELEHLQEFIPHEEQQSYSEEPVGSRNL
ncbi:MAG: acyl-CoA dehydrogenase family protein [Planctomycetes bacterium]|jgi:alkylation response protein AidB-like acyl-CoA dehydrogenase|nr:acyl-CoA dehydrogenase family protein [Planctomycetota bacterium]MDA0947539.1 acyl-CoA dehydrogenase family protein [Planctomycetota bacterium]